MDEIGTVLASSAERAPWGWALLVTVILALIKAWPTLSQMAIDAKTKVRQEKRDDLDECKKRCDLLTARVDAVEEKLHQTDLKLLGAISAYRILDAEIEAKDPTSTALGQARLVMSAAFTLSPSTETSAGSPP